MLPKGWSLRRLSTVLERVNRPVQVESSTSYREIGIRSHGKGIFHKPPTDIAALGEKRVFWVVPNALILNIVFAWEQAVAVTSESEQGMIASHRFPMYLPKNDACDVEFLRQFFCTPRGKSLLELASPGGAGRNKTLGQQQFEKLSVLMPVVNEQRRIRQVLETWDHAAVTIQRLIANSKSRKSAIAQKLIDMERAGIPRRGKRKTIGELVDVQYGKSPIEAKKNNGSYPIVGTGGEIGRSAIYLVKGPSVVIGRKGSISSPRFIEEDFWPIDTTFYCLPKKGCDLRWFYHRLSRIDLSEYNESSGVPSLSRPTLEAISTCNRKCIGCSRLGNCRA
jgi:type I restriction enzyme S subunit